MRKVALLLVLSVIAFNSFAQNSAVNRADRYVNSGELDQAKEYIDQAVVHEKTVDKGKTWYTKGQVYKAIAFSDDPTFQNLDDNPFEEAVEAYHKAQDMEKDGSTYHLFAGQGLQELWSRMLNKGAELYQEGVYEEAIDAFNKTKEVFPEDTTGYLYAGVAAMQGGMYDVAADNYYKLLDLGYDQLDVYTSLLWIERNQNEDKEKALEIVREAREKYPDNRDLMKEEINLLINLEMADEAREKLESAIEAEPDNPSLFYSLAFLYDETGNNEKAVETYKKALELKPDYFEANFNLAVYYFNKGVEILKEANNMDLETYQKKGKEVIAEADKFIEKSIPYLEKAHESQPDDLTVIETLETAYEELKMEDKAEEFRKKMEALGGVQDSPNQPQN
ncbi:MAG: tetratricopeptide repeat protein [Candidatus Cyclobacteriaceae bacterium M3_2C_046]